MALSFFLFFIIFFFSLKTAFDYIQKVHNLIFSRFNIQMEVKRVVAEMEKSASKALTQIKTILSEKCVLVMKFFTVDY